MSIILKGIDLTEMGEKRRITIFDNGDIVVKEERWDEDGYKHYRTLYDVEAIQIPKGHGRLKDFDGDGIHPIIVDDVYMVKVDDLDAIPTILGWEE